MELDDKLYWADYVLGDFMMALPCFADWKKKIGSY